MKEQELIRELSKAIVIQAEEKIKVGEWAFELFQQIDQKIQDHFKNSEDDNTL